MDPFAVYLAAMLTLIGLCIIMPMLGSASNRDKQHQAQERKNAERAEKERRNTPGAAVKTTPPDAPKRKRGRPRKNPTPAAEPEPSQATDTPHDAGQATPKAPAQRVEAISVGLSIVGNNAFVGECVAFTGTIPGMTRAQAIQAVEENGGRAFDTMPAGTTLLVVGDKPGAGKLEKADHWAVKKIDALGFWTMLHTPLTLTPDEFAAFIMARLNTHNAKEA